MSQNNLHSTQVIDAALRFDPIVSDFETALSTLEQVLRHIEETKPDAKLRVVILNNTIVALTSTIEEALRGLFQEYLSILQESFGIHGELRQTLQLANLECAIQALKNHKKKSELKGAATVVSNLDKCLNGLQGYQLFKDQLVYNQGNFKSQQVTEIAKKVGLPDLWQQVCISQDVEDYTGEPTVETRVTRLITSWNEIFDERDIVVHRISQASGWAPDRIQQAIYLCKLVVKRIAACLSEDLTKLITSGQVKVRIGKDQGEGQRIER
ncbi:MAG: HEPN domain-containing protein [Nitrospiraceae bacterium]|nr:HEPN domain-containing protein [Nitrospiraceae bacterium]